MVSLSGDGVTEPFRVRVFAYARWSLAITALFVCTYGTTNWLAGIQSPRLRLYFDWEVGIPFIPWMIWVYLSVQVFVAMPVLVLDSADISRLGRAFALVTGVATIFHILLPADLGWTRPAAVENYAIFQLFFLLDGPYNLVPSLHVAYGTVTFLAIRRAANRSPYTILAALWTVLLMVSVSLVHQHHLVDILGGLAVGALGDRVFQPGCGSANHRRKNTRVTLARPA